MASKSFAVVVCHGSYHTPAPYQALVNALSEKGIETYCPQRPTCDLSQLNVGNPNNPDFDRKAPPGGYPLPADDAAEIGLLLDKLIAKGKSVLLAGHSSGGWVAAEAAQNSRQAPVRAREGTTGGVIGIFFIGAFIVPEGQSVHSFFQPPDGKIVTPPFMRFHKHGVHGLGTMVDPEQYLFNDLDAATAKRWASTLTAAPVMNSPLTHNPYDVLPCAYLVLEKDHTLPREYQEGMVANQSKPFTVYHAPCGHSPHLSWTNELVAKIEEFGNQVLAESTTD
ncbi:alpha/beta-hydrolase [Penicillium digitatum]|uniref:AB hydrolase-1 domain-containing protein n=3 Tax=Penicillium digitatum TaxID=36651 RepID=K9GPQ2_PEND2|nr:hypothetical protein PDIP_62660 [Penicillium digitatum Pd1]EKV09934.1 hypothetical protein PDIP_62660 [Penicillium digitatum Pd1]EKV15141.1 hypothetical protein PDIG_28220 [Penicillium digitatum PHI26]QQK44449.1 alpha/beta-hydrolase [Penicillium digitatum]